MGSPGVKEAIFLWDNQRGLGQKVEDGGVGVANYRCEVVNLVG